MKTKTVRWALLAGTIALAAPPVQAKAPAAPPATVSAAIPTTATSHPLLDATAALQAVGYVQEEYILSGKANVYGWAGSGRGIKVVTADAPYATRLLVWRPAEPRKFS